MIVCFAACSNGSGNKQGNNDNGKDASKSYKVGICNYVDDASLNQIAENIQSQLAAKAQALGVEIEVLYDNCNADQNIMTQIIQHFISEDVDLMIGIATPVVMNMQALTEDNGIPVVFAAVSDPLGTGIVESLEHPGANLTGTSDKLDTEAILNIMLAQNPEIKKVGLLYDAGQDGSLNDIKAAKAFLNAKGVEIIEKTGTNIDEVMLAADALVSKGVEAIFTPTDNTVMTAELSIYESLMKAGVPHYTGANSFALNGAFLGYGVDYINLGKETANIAIDVMINGKDPSEYPVMFFDNGTATINTEICEGLGIDFEAFKAAASPYCTKIETLTTAESF